MTSLEKFARVLKLALICCVALCVFASCNKDENKPNPIGPGGSLGNYKEPEMVGNASLGSTLTLSGQVYKNTNNYPNPYEKWNGNATVFSNDIYDDNGYITGKITNGQLSYSVGQPNLDSWHNTVQEIFDGYQEFFLSMLYDDVTYSHPDVSAFILWGLETEEYYGVVKGGYSYYNQGMFEEVVFYLWVESDVRITAKGGKDNLSDTFKDDIDMQLKAGWNAIYKRQAWSTEISSCIKLGNANLYWIIALD